MTEQATPARVRDYANEVFADAMPPPVPQQQYDAAQLPPHAQGYSRSYSQTTPLPPRVRPDPLAFAPAGYAADTGMMAYTAPVPAQPLQQSPITKSTIHFGDSRSEPQHAQATPERTNFARYRYDQATPEEQLEKQRKADAQQLMRAQLEQQMEEKRQWRLQQNRQSEW
eukprot:TRINITY_DN2134_c0_g1_i2.p1 TRINITY_DN2134_c0_g1~~TRINITY_DN2134_c0_g1_i2.p1  ORF type:complete len:169 (+),score=43.69 TRINITY_DN2134_c0_g1_i2:799-1305(+)